MIEGAMRESTESSIGMWIECVRRHLHHMGFTTSPFSPALSHPIHPSSSSDQEDADEHYNDTSEGFSKETLAKLKKLADKTDESESDSDAEDDRFIDAREVLHYGQGISPAEEVVLLRSAVTGLEREVSGMERQLSRALTRIAGELALPFYVPEEGADIFRLRVCHRTATDHSGNDGR